MFPLESRRRAALGIVTRMGQDRALRGLGALAPRARADGNVLIIKRKSDLRCKPVRCLKERHRQQVMNLVFSNFIGFRKYFDFFSFWVLGVYPIRSSNSEDGGRTPLNGSNSSIIVE